MKSGPNHGGSGTLLYGRWCKMFVRCYRQYDKHYHNYGGRGIKVCERWHKYQNFREDMGPTFREDYQLNRINNDGDYEPGNCNWVPRQVNMRNTRRTRKITFKGETKVLAQWCIDLGIKSQIVSKRIKRGWPVDMLFDAPKTVRDKRFPSKTRRKSKGAKA